MSWRDSLAFALRAVLAHRLRSALTMLGIVIGIASVLLLTSLGEGTRRALVSEFTQFGTNLLSVTRGRATTTGVPGGMLSTVRKLTVEDAEALRRVRGVRHVVPVAIGTARVEAGERSRSVVVYGVNAEVPAVWKFAVGAGRFLPPLEAGRDAPLAVLGPKLKRELLGDTNALGTKVRIGGRRFLVIGVLQAKGLLLGFDLDDTVYVPVAAAQSLFGRDELQEIDVLFSEGLSPAFVADGVRRVLLERHAGNEDFTIVTQTEMLDTLDRILGVVSVAVGGIGAISLLVGAIGILTMMWISVNERTREVGLLRALGLTRRQVQRVFLLEAALLSTAGGVAGILVGLGLGQGLRLGAHLPVDVPPGMPVSALAFCTLVGLLSGILPARRAAALNPVDALRAE